MIPGAPRRCTMTEWIVDHIDWVLIFLGLVAAALAVAWWNTRRRPYLIGAAAMVGLMLVCYVASLFIVTDAMQLSRNVDGIRDAINAANRKRPCSSSRTRSSSRPPAARRSTARTAW